MKIIFTIAVFIFTSSSLFAFDIGSIAGAYNSVRETSHKIDTWALGLAGLIFLKFLSVFKYLPLLAVYPLLKRAIIYSIYLMMVFIIVLLGIHFKEFIGTIIEEFILPFFNKVGEYV